MTPLDNFRVYMSPKADIARTAIIGKPPIRSATLARQPGAAENDTVINDGAVIDEYAVIFLGAAIGPNSIIGALTTVRENVVVGSSCTIGIHVEISHDCVISDRVRIQDGCHITGGTIIGEGAFLGPKVVTASDNSVAGLRAYVWDEKHHAPPIIGKGAVIGAGAMLLPGVVIGENAVIGMGAVVTKSVPAGETWIGNPARRQGGFEMAGLPRMSTADVDEAQRLIGAGDPRSKRLAHWAV